MQPKKQADLFHAIKPSEPLLRAERGTLSALYARRICFATIISGGRGDKNVTKAQKDVDRKKIIW